MSDQGSRRYPRTFGGLIASMIVLVVVVVPLALLNHWWSDAGRSSGGGVAPVTPPVDYLSVVREVQQSGQSLVYPPKVPAEWTVTSADWDINTDPTRPQWRLGIVAPGQQFVGFYEQNAPAETLVGETIGKDARRGEDATISTAVGEHWSSWSDSGGDIGYATAVGKHTLVVYGTSDADVRSLMGTLTDAKLPHASRQS